MAGATLERATSNKPGALATRVHRHLNWPLAAGGTLVALIIVVACFGPALAPRDPLERTAVIQVNGRFYSPPIPPFLTSAFPLGTDIVGRDLVSQLLWAVQPTMAMVAVVAGVRLALGLLLGAVAGWSRSWIGRALDTLADLATSVPILIVALGAITVIGVQNGLIAFVVGLALTGWAETARLTAAQVRILRDQPYIQAARALGASGLHVLVRHMLRHLAPLAVMLFTFEISATLLVVGALGFLGYYIGGATRVEVSDFVQRLVATMPELGQMLSTALVRLLQPAPMIVIGSVIFLIVLAFNLLGEGLRRESQREFRPSRVSRAIARPLRSVEEELLSTTANWGRGTYATIAGVVLAGMLIWSGASWWQARAAAAARLAAIPTPAPTAARADQIPGGHAWSGARGDPRGSLNAPADEIAPELAWSYAAPGPLSGSPAIAANGAVYLATGDGMLVALNPDGTEQWQAGLDDLPVGGPALGLDGTVYVALASGELAAIAPDGTPAWTAPPGGKIATSGPVVGPDGMIYYTVVDSIRAVAPDGTPRWQAFAVDDYVEFSPRLSADGALLFLRESALSTADGSARAFPIVPPDQADLFVDGAFFVGADGQNYYRHGAAVYSWSVLPDGTIQGRQITAAQRGAFRATDQGVSKDGLLWSFDAEFGPASIEWTEQSGNALGGVYGLAAEARILGMQPDGGAYICGPRAQAIACVLAHPGEDAPAWQVQIPGRDTIAGGAVIPGRVYITTRDGQLHAIGTP